MSASPTVPAGGRRWWTIGLLVHAGLLSVLLCTDPPSLATDPYSWAARADFAGRLALSTPWWLLPVPFGGLALTGDSLTRLAEVLPAVVNLLLHVVAVPLLSRRPTGERAGGRPPQRWALSRSTVFFLAAAAGGLVWAAWLGWDHSPSYDVVTRQVESPYVSLQVLGCALSVGAVAALMGWRWSPVASAGGVSAGFWFLWTAEASSDETGLFMIGALLLGAGLLLGTASAAILGWAVRRGPQRVGASS